LRVEESLLDRVGGERSGGVVDRRGFLVPAEAAQQVGACRVEQVVAVEAAPDVRGSSTAARPAAGPRTSASATARLSATTGVGVSAYSWS
jgi:hypothetical protein